MNEPSQVVEIMRHFAQLGLTELKLKSPDFELSLCRNSASSDTVAIPCASTSAPHPQSLAVPPDSLQEQTADHTDSTELHTLISPLVGTFYRSPAPNKPPFIREGSHVKQGDVVAIVEAMKVMNNIEADASGIVEKIIPADGEMVEFDTPLILIRKE